MTLTVAGVLLKPLAIRQLSRALNKQQNGAINIVVLLKQKKHFGMLLYGINL